MKAQQCNAIMLLKCRENLELGKSILECFIRKTDKLEIKISEYTDLEAKSNHI